MIPEQGAVYYFVHYPEIVVYQDNASCPGAFGDVHTYFFCSNRRGVERFVQQEMASFAVEDKFGHFLIFHRM